LFSAYIKTPVSLLYKKLRKEVESMKKILAGVALTTSVLGAALFTQTPKVAAHGYVQSPPARAYQGKLDFDSQGWTAALSLYGNVITNPQGLEAKKGYTQAGPADGRIASADGAVGDFVLDNQTSTRWKKTTINSGPNLFTWRYTASHKTAKWHYYMTKTGWDQNAPLKRADMEHIGTIDYNGGNASANPTHSITVPTDRTGYHVILAVWDVDDTDNAFYNVIDVNVNTKSNTYGPSL